MYVFDLEGTLVSTRESRRLAWNDVNVRVTPENLSRSWHLWLPALVGEDEAQARHDAMLEKWMTRRYASSPLPIADLAHRLGNFAVLTDFTQAMTDAIIRFSLAIDPAQVVINHDLSTSLKLATLKSYGERADWGIYTTNDAQFAAHARECLPSRWVISVAQAGVL